MKTDHTARICQDGCLENICDRYVIMKKGRIIADGSQSELTEKVHLSEEATMEQLYLKLVDEYE